VSSLKVALVYAAILLYSYLYLPVHENYNTEDNITVPSISVNTFTDIADTVRQALDN
jgi:hypothetical protein